MAKTVAAAAIGITADTTSARNELSQIRRILRETQEPTQKLEADIALLEKRINSSEQADEALIAALEKKRAELPKRSRRLRHSGKRWRSKKCFPMRLQARAWSLPSRIPS